MIVVKFGGHAMKDENGAFATSIREARDAGVTVVVVHGGGPQIAAALSEAGMTSEFSGGFRVTTPEIFDIVERVLTEEVGPTLAHTLNSYGVQSRALSGRQESMLIAQPLTTLVDGTAVDLGLVGEVTQVHPHEIHELLKFNIVPVIAPIASGVDGLLGYNVNADLAAAAIAGALDADWLIIMTDVPGIYRNWPDEASLISSISVEELTQLKGSFSQGMAPKVQACIDAISAGAKAVRIIDGTDARTLKSALLGEGGTLVFA